MSSDSSVQQAQNHPVTDSKTNDPSCYLTSNFGMNYSHPCQIAPDSGLGCFNAGYLMQFPWMQPPYYHPQLMPPLERDQFYPGSVYCPQLNLEPSIEKPTQLSKNSILSKLLQEEGPTRKIPSIPPKTSGKVLTSIENLKAIEDKQKLKQEIEQQKLERQEKGMVRLLKCIVFIIMFICVEFLNLY